MTDRHVVIQHFLRVVAQDGLVVLRQRRNNYYRVLIALHEAHLLTVKILQICVPLPLAEILGQPHNPPHDFAAPCEVHVVAGEHGDAVEEGWSFIVRPKTVRNLRLQREDMA